MNADSQSGDGSNEDPSIGGHQRWLINAATTTMAENDCSVHLLEGVADPGLFQHIGESKVGPRETMLEPVKWPPRFKPGPGVSPISLP